MASTRPIIDAICERLQQDIPDAMVDVYPDNPQEYNFIHPSGTILVGYRSSRFSDVSTHSRPKAADFQTMIIHQS